MIKGMTSCRPPEKSNESEIKSNESEMDLIDRRDAIEAFWELNISLRPSAIDAIINMLRTVPSANLQQNLQPCNQLATDCISREAAIDAMKSISDSICEQQAIDALCELPSAQPETHEERTETHACDLISRQAAVNRINKQREHLQPEIYPQDEIGDAAYRICAEFIERLPPAQPEPCGDVVSRNAIVQKLNEMDRYVSTELRLCDTDKKFPQNEVFIVDDVYEEIVEQLPSAQPDLSGYSDRLWTAAYERGKAEAQPEIIHCGECKYYHDSDGCFFSTATTGADGFCHWAERKEGGAE